MTRLLAFAALLLSVARTGAAQSPAPSAVPPPPPPAYTPAPPPTATPPATAATPAATPAPAGAAAASAAAPAAAAPAATPAPPAAAPAPQAAPPAQPAPAVAQPAPPPPQQPAAAATAAPSKPRGRIFTWFSAGSTFAYGETYGSVNFGLGYLMASGLTPNLELSYAFGSSPTLWAMRPGITWYTSIPIVRPYVGVYYTHWFVGSDLPDENGVGARMGISLGRVISLGVTYDRILDCDRNCDSWSPVVSAGFSM